MVELEIEALRVVGSNPAPSIQQDSTFRGNIPAAGALCAGDSKRCS